MTKKAKRRKSTRQASKAKTPARAAKRGKAKTPATVKPPQGVGPQALGGNAGFNAAAGGATVPVNAQTITITPTNIDHLHNFTTDSGAGCVGVAHNNIQPTTFLNAMIRL